MTSTQVHEVLNQLTVLQMRQLTKEFHLKTSGNRDQLISTLLRGPSDLSHSVDSSQFGGARFNRDKLTHMYLEKLNNEIDRRNDRKYLQKWLTNDPRAQEQPDAITLFRTTDPTESGEYTEWIIKGYLQGGINKLEDLLSRVTPALSNFVLLSAQKKLNLGNSNEPWTNQYNLNNFIGLSGATIKGRRYLGLEDLLESHRSVLQQHETDVKATQQIHQDLPIVFENDLVTVYKPLTKEASCYIGRGTRWCTAAKHDNMFKGYFKEGPIFVIVPKNPSYQKEKYQYHHKSNQYMDSGDTQVDPINLFEKFNMQHEISNLLPRKITNEDEHWLSYLDKLVEKYSDIKIALTLIGVIDNSFKFVNYSKNIVILFLIKNDKVDISPLNKLIKLETLHIIENPMIDIKPLEKLTNLKQLELFNNNITDITPLSALTNLEFLELNPNKIFDISPLSFLTNLYYLNLANNQISDVSPLISLTKLYDLKLSDNPIKDISSLIKLTNLRYLEINYTNMSKNDRELLKKSLPKTFIAG